METLNHPSNQNIISQTEIDDFSNYLWLKAISLNTQNGKLATGIFGGALLAALGATCNALTLAFLWSNKKPPDTANEWWEAGYNLLGVPGAAIGLVTSPLRRLSLCERELRYSNSRADYFIRILQIALANFRRGDCPPIEGLTLPKLFEKITAAYQGNRGETSSSEFLIYQLRGKTIYYYPSADSRPGETLARISYFGPATQDNATRAQYLIQYLSAEETPASMINSKNYRKNQGKPLFNLIMDLLEREGEQLLPKTTPPQTQRLFRSNVPDGESDEVKLLFKNTNRAF